MQFFTLLILLLAPLAAQCATPEAGSHAETDQKADWSITPDLALPNVLILGDSISIEYMQNMRVIVATLKTTGAKLIFATTTPVVSETKNPLRTPQAPLAYNGAAVKIMQENQIAVNDLYAYCLPNLGEWQLPKNVHFKPAGSDALATQVATIIAE